MLTHVLPFRATERKGGDGGSGVGEYGGNLQGVGGSRERGPEDTSETPFLNASLQLPSRLMKLDGSVCRSRPDGTIWCFGPLFSLFCFEILGTHTVNTGGEKIPKGYFCLVCKDQ